MHSDGARPTEAHAGLGWSWLNPPLYCSRPRIVPAGKYAWEVIKEIWYINIHLYRGEKKHVYCKTYHTVKTKVWSELVCLIAQDPNRRRTENSPLPWNWRLAMKNEPSSFTHGKQEATTYLFSIPGKYETPSVPEKTAWGAVNWTFCLVVEVLAPAGFCWIACGVRLEAFGMSSFGRDLLWSTPASLALFHFKRLLRPFFQQSLLLNHTLLHPSLSRRYTREGSQCLHLWTSTGTQLWCNSLRDTLCEW